METRRSRRQREKPLESATTSTEIILTHQGRPAYRVMTGRNVSRSQASESPGSEHSSDRPSGVSSDTDQAEGSPFERNPSIQLRQGSGGQGVESGRRLYLEHTFNEGGENRLTELLASLDRAIRGSDQQPQPLNSVIDLAKGINQIRLNQGEEPERLTHVFGHSHLHGDHSYVDESWNRTNPMRLTPTHLAPIAAEVRNGTGPARQATFWLSLGNYCVRIQDLVKMFQAYRGPPCNIMDNAAAPRECQPILSYLKELYTVKFSLAQEILEASSTQEAEILQARLTELQVEHCCLCNLMITSNTRLFGPWKHQWAPHKEFRDDICSIMESLDMSESQIERFRRLRQSMLSQINNLTLGESCMMDLVREMLDKVLRLEAPLDVDTKMYLLSKVEAASSAQISRAAFEYCTTETMLSRILSPIQSAHLMDKVSMLLTTKADPESVRYMADRVRVFGYIVLDPELSSWMDEGVAEDHLCPPGLFEEFSF